MSVLCILAAFVLWKKLKRCSVPEVEEYFKQMPGVPKKFSYKELLLATEDFKEKLGSGGFGSVFKGILEDGTRIAVKRLDGMGQGIKEFLAEVKTIGSIHHFNLVRLVGFCAEKSWRLLVYEYMSNGSLDHWIFCGMQRPALDWPTRKKIILDIAKGVAYLHEECRQRIIHLDIKPQNILLDDRFSAKLSDFGLSKLMDRDQSQVLTNMRGTPGYLAPEWRKSVITVKADIYSFGIVVLEIVCGRKNLDRSQPECKTHLLSLLQKKADMTQLIEIVEWLSHEDIQCHREDMEKMIRMAVWCLQDDPDRRPTMSVVVKVLEGLIEVETSISYRFCHAMVSATEAGFHPVSTPPQDSVLSTPR
ncbi:hypothetical protein AAC387_Pa08g2455 [Persea americana]|eukprot:TRINITY_DN10171_c0_g1_i7.p1 TRINITY_DN10171_c0_g1~~TRINITY_DN10171_c0_g1_i7.p1  ORF type:complete len:361 (-),score=72.95 TRINITY_DN10171_c0_g1_i7:292-1374(-)